VLEYFDAHIIGLTATPNKQTFGFFNQNLAMEYGHEQAVADGVNVNYDVYRIKTEITEAGFKVDAGYFLDKRDTARSDFSISCTKFIFHRTWVMPTLPLRKRWTTKSYSFPVDTVKRENSPFMIR